MLFNSLDFAFFLPLVFGIYWFVFSKQLKAQNWFLVAASYLFYGWWDWRFLFLIAFSSLLDFTIGLRIADARQGKIKKYLLWTSLAVNLGFLGFFKYYNFFLDNFVHAFTLFGTSFDVERLNIILPVGISFYTFQTLSYTIDVYKGKLKPTRDIASFLAYVSFFPQLVAGPIERAMHLLPQFYKKRKFSYPLAVDGLRQMLWGFFKKMVIADNCAEIANHVFGNYGDMGGADLFIGALAFAFQIYGDFSGYSDIAIGLSKLFGFDLMQNFSFPYFSRDFAEFWRRWHISLSTWFRDYLYIPLGGSRGGKWMQLRNTMIIFLVSGFWHGANWTFVAWGGLNALFFVPLLLRNKNRQNLDIVAIQSVLPTIRELVQMGATFFFTIVAWVFFRSESLKDALVFLWRMATKWKLEVPNYYSKSTWVFVLLFIVLEWIGRRDKYAIQYFLGTKHWLLRWLFYYAIVMFVFLFATKEKEFIYFQF
jgi:D-alanyl-lipoteichoic acid acyltransferase DltB (MBOAT superfamily)